MTLNCARFVLCRHLEFVPLSPKLWELSRTAQNRGNTYRRATAVAAELVRGITDQIFLNIKKIL